MIVLIARKVCNFIFANIKHVNNFMLIKLYKSFATNMPVICCPHHINPIECIENVPSRFTNRLFG